MNFDSSVLQIPIEDIIPNRFQPRRSFDDDGLQELADSIRQHGIIQPLVLRPNGDKYEIVAGERRYKAAQLADPEKADGFLTNLRHATVIDCRPTTHLDVILDVVRSTGIDEGVFLSHYNDGSAEAALENDLSYTARLGIRSLPTCLIQYKGKALLMNSFAYADHVEAIMALIDG